MGANHGVYLDNYNICFLNWKPSDFTSWQTTVPCSFTAEGRRQWFENVRLQRYCYAEIWHNMDWELHSDRLHSLPINCPFLHPWHNSLFKPMKFDIKAIERLKYHAFTQVKDDSEGPCVKELPVECKVPPSVASSPYTPMDVDKETPPV